MSCNKEISSCTAPEGSGTPVYHASGKFLNSSSNALRHILRTYKFSKLYMPAYCSREMKETALQECREVLFYTVGPELKPAGFFPKTSAIYYPNYFGVCGRTVRYLGMRHPNLIVDNSQSFYSDPRGLGSLYDPSSYFGLPDGGIAVSRKGNDTVYPDEMFSEEACAEGDENLEGIENIESAENADEKVETVENIEGTENIENSVSSANTENPEDTKTAESSEAKAEEVQAVQIINMSSETRSLLENMDHDSIKARRLRNFRFLAKHLEPEKEWRLFEDDVPFAYPYFTEDFQIHQLFEESEFKLPVSFEGTSGYAEKLTRCYLPLSVDQKYDINDMKVIAEMILGHEVKVEKDDWLLDAASDETTEELELNEAVSADADDEAEAETQQDASQDTVEENPENVRTT